MTDTRPASPASSDPTGIRVLTAPTLLTGRPSEQIRDAAVVLDGDQIAWVGPVAGLPADFAAIPREDHPGATIMPGLIETHAHLGARPGRGTHTPDPARHAEGWNALASVASLRALGSIGVTSVQSLSSKYYTDVAVREAVEQGVIDGPRVVAAGPMVTTTGGHDWMDGGEVDSLDDIRHAVRDHHKAGVDVIKVAATGGFLTPGTAQWKAQFTVRELQVLVDEAHRLGKRVAAHAHGTEGIERAVEAGVDYIGHASFISADGTTRFDPALADRIAEAGIYVDCAAPPTYPPIDGETIAPRAFELYQHGVRIVAGHDIGAVIPPHAYLYGLSQLEASGLPRPEVLVAATSRAAAAIGLAGVAGVLDEGYSADLLVLDGNPLDDLGALARKRAIIVRGTDFRPDPVPAYEGLGDLPGGPADVLARHQEIQRRRELQDW